MPFIPRPDEAVELAALDRERDLVRAAIAADGDELGAQHVVEELREELAAAPPMAANGWRL